MSAERGRAGRGRCEGEKRRVTVVSASGEKRRVTVVSASGEARHGDGHIRCRPTTENEQRKAMTAHAVLVLFFSIAMNTPYLRSS